MKALAISVGLLALLPLIGFGTVYLASEWALRDTSSTAPFTGADTGRSGNIENGRYVARTRGCLGCHGQQLEGYNFDEQWDWPERAIAPNLTKYVREHDAATIERAIRKGIGHDGKALMSMPSFNFARLTDSDIIDLISFMKSLPPQENPLPEPILGWSARLDLVLGRETTFEQWVRAVPPLQIDPAADPLRARGEYLALTMCNECHGLDVRGNTMFEPYTPDLAMVAALSREDFERLIETGIGVDGRRLGLMALVGPDRFPALKTADIDALYAYLAGLIDEPVAEGVFWRPG